MRFTLFFILTCYVLFLSWYHYYAILMTFCFKMYESNTG